MENKVEVKILLTSIFCNDFWECFKIIWIEKFDYNLDNFKRN